MSRSTRYIAVAMCDCGWQDDAAGCQGRAAQHHDRTGHEVLVNISVYYGDPVRATPGQEALDVGPASDEPGTLFTTGAGLPFTIDPPLDLP
jgi:hypothetical protein